MRNRLFILGSFAHDPQSILATVCRLAFVGIKCGFNGLLGVCLKLRIATLAYADHWWSFFHDPQLAPWHASSLAHLARRSEGLWISNGTTTQVCGWIVGGIVARYNRALT